VDTSLETEEWKPLCPTALPLQPRIFFIDGVRRIEHRLLVEMEQQTVFGLAGSFAIGATEIAAKACVTHQKVERVASVGGGLSIGSWSIRLPSGRAVLDFSPLPVAENTPEAPLQGLQNAMRQAEAQLAQELSSTEALVFLDGPLTFFTAAKIPVVGFVKRLLRNYLTPEQGAILRQLAVGERTPIFLIKETRHQRYSWYCRIGVGRLIDSSLTGIVRLEASSSLDLQKVRSLADLSTPLLPRFASAYGHDPRAPQNLYPIAGLENTLRHALGDPLVIRRAIEMFLHNQEAA
jgi:hypothetical protein